MHNSKLQAKAVRANVPSSGNASYFNEII